MKNFYTMNRAILAKKKFFSLLCALMMVLSVSATPQFNAKKAPQGKHNFELVKKMIAEKGRPAVKKAPARLAATEVTIVDCSGMYYSEDGEFVYTLIDEDGIEYYFAFPSTGADIESGKTYTLADMEDEDSYWMDWDLWEYGSFTAVTFLKTQDSDGGVKIVVNATDQYGTEFVLTYEFKVTGESITIVAPESVDKPKYYSDGDWYFSGHNAEYEFALDFYGDQESIVGEYTFADFYLYYTYIYDVENEVQLSTKDVKASIAAGENDTLYINAEILGSDGVKYMIKAFYAAPSAKAQETLSADNLGITQDEYDDGWDYYDEYIFSASDEKNAIYILWIDWDEVGSYSGSYDVTDIDGLYVTPAGKDYSNAASGTITIAEEDGVVTITGTILCYNNVEYTLNLTNMSQGIENIVLTEKAQKVMVDGAVYIIRDNKLFNLQGAQVR